MIKRPRPGSLLMQSDLKKHVNLGAISAFGPSSWPLLGPPLTEAYDHLTCSGSQKSALGARCDIGLQTGVPKSDLGAITTFSLGPNLKMVGGALLPLWPESRVPKLDRIPLLCTPVLRLTFSELSKYNLAQCAAP